MTTDKKPWFDAKILIGLFIIIVGLVFLLENLGYIHHIDIWQFWPVIPILIGIGQIAKPKQYRNYTSGAILIIVGAVFLGNNLDIINFNIGDIWPLFLILVGFSILKHAIWKPKAEETNVDFIDMNFILSGGEFNFASKKLTGGKLTAIMGGGELDLRDAVMAGDEVIIDVFAFWGGIDLRVPKTWRVVVHATPFMGGIESKVSTTADSTKTLIIKGTAIMGGVEIKN